jgi:hypothetical protein
VWDDRTVKGWIPVALVLTLLLGAGLGMLFGGTFLIVVQETGEPATARIIECHRSGGRYRTDVCTGMWVAGGSLLEDGRMVTGTVDGASSDDLGKSLDVRLSGDRAYTKSRRVAIILLILGAGVTALGVRVVWTTIAARRRRASQTAAG